MKMFKFHIFHVPHEYLTINDFLIYFGHKKIMFKFGINGMHIKPCLSKRVLMVKKTVLISGWPNPSWRDIMALGHISDLLDRCWL